MGVLLGPFSQAEWITMRNLKEDLAASKKELKGDPNYDIVLNKVEKTLKKYMRKKAA